MPKSLTSNAVSEGAPHGYHLLRESCGTFTVDGVSILEMTGDDRKAWLQGQCTNELRSLTLGVSVSFCVCTPTGQMVANCTVYGLQDRFLILCPTVCVRPFLDRVEMMVIIENVQVRDVSSDYRLISVQGPEATRALGESVSLPALDAGTTDKGEVLLRSNRSGLGGWDVLIPKGASRSLISALDKLGKIAPEALEIARIETGIPRFGVDMNERTLPPEMGEDFVSKHINYRKGCYTGQEVMMRIHSRGHTNRTWVGLILDDKVKPGDVVSHGSRTESGLITSAAESPRFGFIAAAMLRREAAFEGEEISVASSSGLVAGEVAIMPIFRIG